VFVVFHHAASDSLNGNGRTVQTGPPDRTGWLFRLALRPIEIASVHLPSKTRSIFGDFQAPSRVRAIESILERAMGIEPTSEAWEALNKTLKTIELAALNFSQR
jgi:hypothetical protein